MKFNEMKVGQLLGATFPDDAMPEFAGKTTGYRVKSLRSDDNSESIHVEDVKTGERTTFVNTEGIGTDWECWSLIEPAVEQPAA